MHLTAYNLISKQSQVSAKGAVSETDNELDTQFLQVPNSLTDGFLHGLKIKITLSTMQVPSKSIDIDSPKHLQIVT